MISSQLSLNPVVASYSFTQPGETKCCQAVEKPHTQSRLCGLNIQSASNFSHKVLQTATLHHWLTLFKIFLHIRGLFYDLSFGE